MKKVASCFLVFVLMGCHSNKFLQPSEYTGYFDNAGSDLKKSVKAGNILYTIQIAPPEYMACKQYADELKTDTIDCARRIKELKNYMFFLIKIEDKARLGNSINERIANNSKAEQMVSYYQERAASDIALVQNSRSIAPVTYLYENNYGLAPYNTIVVGFETSGKLDDMSLVFNDHYTNCPLIKASFLKSKLVELPGLHLN